MLAYGERDHELVSMMEITKRKVKLKIKTPVVVIVNISSSQRVPLTC